MDTASLFFYISIVLFSAAAVFHFLSGFLKKNGALFAYLGMGANLLLFPALLLAEATLSTLVLVMLFSLFLYTGVRYFAYVKGKGKEEGGEK